MSEDNVVSLYPSNFRDVPATLRQIADQIEKGQFGEVGSTAVVILRDTMDVFGLGEDSEPCAIGMLLHAAFQRMSRQIEEHGR